MKFFHKLYGSLMAPPFKAVLQDHSKATGSLSHAWKSKLIPRRQWRLVTPQLRDFANGTICHEFQIFLEAIATCKTLKGTSSDKLLEVGCSSGYYGHILKSKFPEIRYTGIDYSEYFIKQGKNKFPDIDLRVGNATCLDFKNHEFQIVISGCVLLHVYDWKLGLQESCRVAENFVIFHRTPVISQSTTLLTKYGYFTKMFEWAFNEKEFLSEVESSGFIKIKQWAISDHKIPSDDAQKPAVVTYLFQRT